MHAVIKSLQGSEGNPLLITLSIVFIHMKWEYDRRKIEFGKTIDLVNELNALGADDWEIINYEEKKPEKFGGKYESIIIIKRLKPACDE